MAIYHCNVKVIGRSRCGKSTAAAAYVSGSVVAGIAYRSGEKIQNQYDGQTHDYTKKSGVVYSEIILPENAPKEFQDRETLWNAVELKNKRCDAQLARECEVSLPRELSREEQIEIVREYTRKNFVEKGVCVDFSIHDKGDGNPHAHIMLTMNEVTQEGFGKRRSEEQGKEYFKAKERLKLWREDWANVCNRHLEEKGIERIDHRTLEAQGIDRVPTIHLGKEATKMERQGIKTERGEVNRETVKLNMELLKCDYIKLSKNLVELSGVEYERQREIAELKKGIGEMAYCKDIINASLQKQERLQKELDGAGFFEVNKKNELKQNISEEEKRREYLVKSFEKKYGYRYDYNSLDYSYRLEKGLKRELEKLERNKSYLDNAKDLKNERRMKESEYKKQRISAERYYYFSESEFQKVIGFTDYLDGNETISDRRLVLQAESQLNAINQVVDSGLKRIDRELESELREIERQSELELNTMLHRF